MATTDCQVLLSWRDEYATLREELLSTIRTRNEVLAFTLAAVGVLIGAATKINESTKGLFPWVAFTVMTPAVICFAYGLWCAEYLRMARASKQLAWVEYQVNACLGAAALTWELERRSENAKNNSDEADKLLRHVKLERVRNIFRKRIASRFGRSSIDLHLPVTLAAILTCIAFPLCSALVPRPKGAGLFLYVVPAIILSIVWSTEHAFSKGRDEFGKDISEEKAVTLNGHSGKDEERRSIMNSNCVNCPARIRRA